MDLKKLWESARGNMKSASGRMGAGQWAVLLLLGLLLAVIALPVSDGREEGTGLLKEADTGQTPAKTELEEKLEALLGSVEGVGEVQVILMTGEEKGSQSFYDSGSLEVTGVLIAAEGGDNPETVQNIMQAVMALFQVEAHKIKVMKMK